MWVLLLSEVADGKRGEGSRGGCIAAEVPQKAKGLYMDKKEGKAPAALPGAPAVRSAKDKGQETSEGWKGAVAVENFSHIREEEKRVIIMDGSVAGPRKKQQFSHVGLISTSVLSE